MQDSKQQLVDYVYTATPQVLWDRVDELSAPAIATRFGISRTLASQYLNEATAAGTLVKINSRPVCFLHRIALAGPVAAELLASGYESADALRAALLPGRPVSVFSRLVGYSGSLAYCVERCKAAMSYPGNGLPLLLHGPTGTGKSVMARMMRDYGVEKGVLSAGSKFMAVNCAEYANNPELLTANLFGHRKGAYTGAHSDRQGLLALADKGVLFLDEVHCLSGECQEKLFLFMDQGVYHMMGDNETWHTSDLHLVMATTENPHVALLQTMLRRIPIIAKLPPLSARPLQEKREMMYHFLREEALHVGCPLEVSSYVYKILMEYEFPENIGQLENCLRAGVASALLDRSGDAAAPLALQLRHLPDYILNSGSARLLVEEAAANTMLTLEQLAEQQQGGQQLYRFNRDVLRQLAVLKQQDGTGGQFFSYARIRFEQYLDELRVNVKRDETPREALYADIVKGICESAGRRFGLTFHHSDVLSLCQLMNDYAGDIPLSTLLVRQNHELILAGLEFYRKDNPAMHAIVREVAEHISGALNLEITDLGLLDLCVCFYLFTSRLGQRKAVGVLLFHGYSIASGMAAMANHLLGQHIFEVIDVPMDATPQDMIARISAYLAALNGVKDVLILMDRGMPDAIAAELQNVDNLNLAIISNATVELTLSVGKLIGQDVPVAAIAVECASAPTQHMCALLGNRHRQAAILTVCPTGIGTAEHIARLLTDSFPRPLDVAVLPYSFDSLQAMGYDAPVFDQYDVLFVVGTDNPIPGEILFFALEDLIMQRGASEVNSYLDAYFTPEELRRFNDNLIKQFSLGNLLGQLTVLNPEKIVGYVEDVIACLQHRTGRSLRGNTMVGLYIHIACLIERLITDKQAVPYEDIDLFRAEHASFIDMARESFGKVGRDYGVDIPESEIAYLYEYLYRL